MKPAVATTAVLSLVVNMLVLLQVRGHVTTHRLPGLFAGFLVGVGPGLLVLEYVSGDVLEIIVGAVRPGRTVLLYLQPQIDASEDTLPIRMLAGAASGASAASTGIGGPPVVLYMIGRENDMQRFRATLQAYFLPISIVTLVAVRGSWPHRRRCSHAERRQRAGDGRRRASRRLDAPSHQPGAIPAPGNGAAGRHERAAHRLHRPRHRLGSVGKGLSPDALEFNTVASGDPSRRTGPTRFDHPERFAVP